MRQFSVEGEGADAAATEEDAQVMISSFAPTPPFSPPPSTFIQTPDPVFQEISVEGKDAAVIKADAQTIPGSILPSPS